MTKKTVVECPFLNSSKQNTFITFKIESTESTPQTIFSSIDSIVVAVIVLLKIFVNIKKKLFC